MRKLVALCFLLGFPSWHAANAQQCPQGQQAYSSRATAGVRTLTVPGNASGMFSGVIMRKGNDYMISATGSIRVGVFGETGTSPVGWEPQGSAGNGFPSPDAYTFSLIYRKGRSGPWNFAGTGPTRAWLRPNEPEQTELFLAINDNKTSDNSGSFDVTINEVVISYNCRIPPPMPTTTAFRPFVGGVASASKNTPRTPTAPKLPCAGKTPDGYALSFPNQFGEYCSGVDTTRALPVEACTYEEARNIAIGYLSYGCRLAEIK